MMPLLARRPHDVLAVADAWPLLLDVVEWLVRATHAPASTCVRSTLPACTPSSSSCTNACWA